MSKSRLNPGVTESIINALTATTTSAVFIFDGGQLCYANAAVSEISGYSQEELFSINISTLVDFDYLDQVTEWTEARLHGAQSPSRFELKIIRKDGVEAWLDLTVDVIDFNGHPAILGTGMDITMRKKLESDLLRQADELSILYALSVDISAIHDYSRLTQKIVEHAVALLRAKSGGLYICNPAQRTIELSVIHNIPDVNPGVTLRYGEGAAGVAAETGEPLIIENCQSWGGRTRSYDHIQSFTAVLAVPIIWQEKVIGVLDVMDDSEKRQFHQSDLVLLTQYATQAAVVMENGRLLDAERRRRQEAETLVQATAVITSSLELDQVLNTILSHLGLVVPFNSASVFLLEGQKLKIVASRGFWEGSNLVGKEFPADDGLFAHIYTSKKSLILEDASADQRFNGWMSTDYVRGWLGVPLIVRDEVIGYVTLDNRISGAYNQDSAKLAEAFINQAASAIENARLFEAERFQVMLAQTLQAVGALLSSQLSLDDVLERILDLLGRVVVYDSASIQLVAPDGCLKLAAGRGFSNSLSATQIVEDLGANILLRKWDEGKAIVIPDVADDPRWLTHPDSDRIRTWVGAPLLVKGNFIGSLNVDSFTPHAYDTITGETVMAFANQAAVAIENTRLFEAERTARERAEALRDAARMITSSLSLDQVLQTVLDQLWRVLPVESGNVMLADGDDFVIKAWRGYDNYIETEDFHSLHFHLNDASLGIPEVVRSLKPLSIANVKNDPRWRVFPTSEHVNSWLGVPILIRDQCIGIVNLDRVSPQGFCDEEISLVQTFAQHASTAIENASLFEAEGQRAAELEAVRQAGLSLTASLDLPDVLDAILQSVFVLLPGAHDTHVFLYYPDADRLAFGAALWAGGRRGRPFSMPRPDGLTHSVARSGEAIVVEDMQGHPLFATVPPNWTGAIIGLPLKIGQRVVGVMNVAYQNARKFNDSELRLLRLLGDQAAIAIENARLYEQAEAEQRHLGLLYEVGQELVSSLNTREILARAISLTCQALDGLMGQAHLYNIEEDVLQMGALYGRPNISVDELNQTYRLKLGEGLIGWAAKYSRAEMVSDVLSDNRWKYFAGVDDDVRSVICAPIIVGEDLKGMLSVFHSQPAAFTLEHLKLLQAICQEVGLALSNASRYDEVQRRLTEITLIQSLAQTFNRRLELQQLLDEVVAQLAARLGYPQVEIFLITGDRLEQRAARGVQLTTDLFSLNEGVIGRVARTGQLALVPDISQDPDYALSMSGTVSELAVPIYRNTVVVGVINIETHIPGQLTTQDRDLLQLLAGQISIALENSVLYERVLSHAEELERIVEQRTAELLELYELSQKIGYALSYNDLMRLLLSHLRKAVNSDLVVGGLFSAGSRLLLVETNRSIAPSAMIDLQAAWLNALQHYNLEVDVNEQLNIEVIASGSYQSNAPMIEAITSSVQVP